MHHGIIIRFFPGRLRNHQRHGYGFIAPCDGGAEVYFHADALQGVFSVPVGAEVTYILVRGNQGHAVQAANVRLVPIAEEGRA
jgi:cold shock CspA family protein